MGLVSLPVLKAFKKRLDPREYNGASFLGLRGIVVKSHGGADSLAFLTCYSYGGRRSLVVAYCAALLNSWKLNIYNRNQWLLPIQTT